MAAGTTARGELVGWVDLPGALDARSLQRSGAELTSVLWVRPERLKAALRCAELLLKAGIALVVLDLDDPPAREPLARLAPAVWARLARAARAARASLLLRAPLALAGTSAALALAVERRRARFESGLLEGLDSTLRVTRTRDEPAPAAVEFQLHHRPA
jgi:hypothetical protein